jgi:hypothetical protein
MSLAKPTLTILGKLIPRLASNHAGEVIAAAAAICRTLQSAGADLHDLCDTLGAEWAPEWRDQVLFCRRHWELLSERERSLIESPERRRGTPTDKQLAFLRVTRLASAS